MINSAYQRVMEAVEASRYNFFKNDENPYNLNLVAFRDETAVNTFNDLYTISWKYKGIENCVSFSCTTDPGLYYLRNPINVKGSAILPYGQHKGLWKKGLHQGKYPALVQRREVGVHRDRNKDSKLNFNGKIDIGWHGINCHRALIDLLRETVDKFSAGCQVFAHGSDHDILMAMIEEAITHWGNSFTYTILPIALIK